MTMFNSFRLDKHYKQANDVAGSMNLINIGARMGMYVIVEVDRIGMENDPDYQEQEILVDHSFYFSEQAAEEALKDMGLENGKVVMLTGEA